jgi:hypothetical protein
MLLQNYKKAGENGTVRIFVIYRLRKVFLDGSVKERRWAGRAEFNAKGDKGA